MTPNIAVIVVVAYFALLWFISYLTSRNAGKDTFFTADHGSHWFLVAFGMIGVALSGITFISVPGDVGNTNFSYLQIVMGYTAGIVVIALVLLPMYYRLKLVSIYAYLRDRFGYRSHKTGAAFFLISQTFMAAFKLYLMTTVLQMAFFDEYGLPFELSVFITLMLIWLYTYKAGIKTIVVTDTLQTAFLIIAAISTIVIIYNGLDTNVGDLVTNMVNDSRSETFIWNWSDDRNFFKMFLTGMFLVIITNGLDQSIMQKSLTVPNIKDAQKNMYFFGGSLVFVNMIFLILGLMLYLYADKFGIAVPAETDKFYPLLALDHLGVFTGIMFLIGIAAAAYSSADSALAGLTTSFCVDVLEVGDGKKEASTKRRTLVHLGFSLMVFFVILVFKALNNESIVNSFIRVAGYTYGPLLGLFVFGMFTKKDVNDKWVPYVAVASPIISLLLYLYSEQLFGFKFGFELLLINGGLTVLGLWFSSMSKKN
ncbi:MAG: sodium:solute symporter [Bacteroidota bacterium]